MSGRSLTAGVFHSFTPQARAMPSARPPSTVCSFSAGHGSEPGAATRLSPACGSPPTCADESTTAADHAAPHSASTTAENDPPPKALAYDPHPNPFRNRDRPDVATFSSQVRDDPMAFPKLEIL